MDDTKSGGAIGTSAINGANPVTGGTFSGTDGIGTGNTNIGDPDTVTIPTGSHGGGMGSGAGLDVDDLQDSEHDGGTITTSGRVDGAGTGNYGDGTVGTEDVQSGVVGVGHSTSTEGRI